MNIIESVTNIAKHPTISLIKRSTTVKELKQIHAQLLLNGTLNIPHFHAQFLATIALHNPINLPYTTTTHLLRHPHNHPNLFALNSIIRAYSKGPTPHHSFHFYNHHILRNNLSPDNYTFNFMIRTCAQLLAHDSGTCLHAAVIKHGFDNDPHVQTGLIFMYAELGCLGSCYGVFRHVFRPDLVCQTAMLHASAKLGDVDFARKMFDEMPRRDYIAWNAMIAGYAQCGRSREALELFRAMQVEGVRLNEVSIVLVLSACTQLGALDQGRWAHAYVERSKLRITVSLGTALVDMYAKCGDIDKAMEVFWEMKERNVYTWSSAIGGLAMNGLGHESLHLFSIMKKDGLVQPNEVTFISVLRGCSVVGLVEEGRRHLESMRCLYGIEPQLEHYGLMVDLYGRSGLLNEALEFINTMPMKPHVGAWSALLHACRMHRNKEIGELALNKILELECKNDGAYVLLSNIYADYKNWESVISLRQKMKAKGVTKLPGCSVIEVDGEAHEFIVGDKSHPRYDEIELKVEEVSRCLRNAGYVTNTNSVLFDIEEEEKEVAVSRHSERLAIAFGLISLKEGIPIRVVMNLRICWDCHEVAKMISKLFYREIIVRDRNRFHHFEDGQCSCKGYW
ncbi:putative pentatricopeptide repeat-containing protein At5g40405 [Arachis duranensis]|uniref:Pentatricopeptide repeat-containing protein At5g40405 n=1 Tax=Arachis duranensis TaxID=130453 RepID=A0A6P4CTB6_ARADU|nr:putative pentatricopeptide repeat-containing protein At5g40405 [Arachis duranensis]